MAAEEQLILDGLTLNDATFGLAELQCPPPRQKRDWIGAADSEWQALLRNPLHDNREITARIQIAPQSTTNLAMDKIGQVVDKLASIRPPSTIALTWTPADGTRTVTFDILAGEIVDMPIDWESGWMVKAPTITIQMTAKPYWRGTEVTGSTASTSTPFVTQTVSYTTGDIPALGRLIVTDTATQSRRHVEWGLENQYYNASTSLLIDSDDMVTSGFAGSGANVTGAYDPNASGIDSITAGIITSATIVAGTGNLLHVGTFRVKGRVAHGTATTVPDVEVRFAWQAADGPWSTNDWATINQVGANEWGEVDLGTIEIPPVVSGTQRWTGRIEARTITGSNSIRVDYLQLIPTAEGYGKARAVAAAQASVLTVYDLFTSTTAAAALNVTTSDSGHGWATSGAATDFAFADASGAFDEHVTRSASAAGHRYGIIGSSIANQQVSCKIGGTISATPGLENTGRCGIIARWTNSSNYLRLTCDLYYHDWGMFLNTVELSKVVAGTTTVLASADATPFPSGSHVTFELTATASGLARGRILNTSGVEIVSLSATDSVLATGGTLDDGTAGILDEGNGTQSPVRRYDDFMISTPPAEPIVLYSGRNMQFRHDEMIRQDSTGTYTGDLPSYRGSRFLVPTGTSRVMVKARRNDVEVASDPNVTDATQIQIAYTPRGVAVPRS
jgi:uncharacterized protein YndB with AHSA1/START domain